MLTLLFLLIALPLSLVAGPLITFLFGPLYGPSIPILKVHIWAGLFVFWGMAQGIWDVATSHTRFSLFRSTVGAVLNILLNLWWLPLYGGLGAAYATVISYGVSGPLMNIFHPQARKVFFLQMRSFLFYKNFR